MNKAELIQALSAYYDGSKSEAAKALNAVVETITYKTAAGEKVSITGFGVFEKVPRSARMVRNPRTGERKRAKATAVPRFRAGTDLKAYVSGAKKVPRATAKKAAPQGVRRHPRLRWLRERRLRRLLPKSRDDCQEDRCQALATPTATQIALGRQLPLHEDAGPDGRVEARCGELRPGARFVSRWR